MVIAPEAAMAAVLARFVGPVRPGQADCCSAPCDAFADLHGIDPMAPLRGRYGDWHAALARVRALGGWRRMFLALSARAGLTPGTGAAGEIGLLRLGGQRILGLSVGGDWWAIRVDGGFQTVRGALLRAGPPRGR